MANQHCTILQGAQECKVQWGVGRRRLCCPPRNFLSLLGCFPSRECESESVRDWEWERERVSEWASIKTQQCVKACVCKFSGPCSPMLLAPGSPGGAGAGRGNAEPTFEALDIWILLYWLSEMWCASPFRIFRNFLLVFRGQRVTQEPSAKSRKGNGRGEDADAEKSAEKTAARHKAQGYGAAGATWCDMVQLLFFSWVFWSLCFRLTETPSNSWAVGLKLPCTCAWCWVPGRCRQADRPGLWRHYWENDQIGTRRKTSCPGTSGEISTARCLDLPTWLSLNTSSPCPSWGQQTSSSTCPWRPEMKDLP